jgi:hypothetical protein
MDLNLNDKIALVTGGSKGIAQFLDENCPHIELKRPGPHRRGGRTGGVPGLRASFINGADYRVDGGSVAAM